jgi:hypothetical protein
MADYASISHKLPVLHQARNILSEQSNSRALPPTKAIVALDYLERIYILAGFNSCYHVTPGVDVGFNLRAVGYRRPQEQSHHKMIIPALSRCV